MRYIILTTTAMALTLTGAAHAQVAGAANTGINVGNGASTVRVDGNSTVRTFGDGTTTITRPAHDAVDNTRLGTEVRSSTTTNPSDSRASINADANTNANINPAAGTTRTYDPATGITRTTTNNGSRVMNSVADTIKSPLGGSSVNMTTSGNVDN